MHALLVAAAVAVVVAGDQPDRPPGDATVPVEVVDEGLRAVLRTDEGTRVERVAATADGAERDGRGRDADVGRSVAGSTRRGDPRARADRDDVELTRSERRIGRGTGHGRS